MASSEEKKSIYGFDRLLEGDESKSLPSSPPPSQLDEPKRSSELPPAVVSMIRDSDDKLDDDDWYQKEQPSSSKKLVVATQKSSRKRVYVLLAALGAVAVGAIYLRSNGEDGDSVKIEKPSANATIKPEPQQPQQSPKYHCRFNYDSSGQRVKAECDGVATDALKIEFDANKSTAKNAVGQLLIDTNGNGEFGDTADVQCGINLLKPADKTESQQLDVVGGLACEMILPKIP